MSKYRKKPVVIEAIQFNGKNHWELNNWSNGKVQPVKSPNHLNINILEGVMIAEKGDFIIKGIKGEFYPCKPDIFEETYELVDEQDKTEESFRSGTPSGPIERKRETNSSVEEKG